MTGRRLTVLAALGFTLISVTLHGAALVGAGVLPPLGGPKPEIRVSVEIRVPDKVPKMPPPPPLKPEEAPLVEEVKVVGDRPLDEVSGDEAAKGRRDIDERTSEMADDPGAVKDKAAVLAKEGVAMKVGPGGQSTEGTATDGSGSGARTSRRGGLEGGSSSASGSGGTGGASGGADDAARVGIVYATFLPMLIPPPESLVSPNQTDTGGGGGYYPEPPKKPVEEAIPDGGVGPDMACYTCGGQACVDLLTDKLHCGACNKPCQQTETCKAGACVGPSDAQYRVYLLDVPELATQFAYNIDSSPDMSLENQFSDFVSKMSFLGNNVEMTLNNLILNQQTNLIIQVPPPNDPSIRPLCLHQGDLNMAGGYVLNSNNPAACFPGFNPAAPFPFTAQLPLKLSSRLYMIIPSSGGLTIVLPMTCMRIVVTQIDATHIDGFLYGVISNEVFNDSFIRKVAAYMDYEISPGSPLLGSDKLLLQGAFDKGKCTDPQSGKEALEKDNHIDFCELKQSPLKSYFLPDPDLISGEDWLLSKASVPDAGEPDGGVPNQKRWISFGLAFYAEAVPPSPQPGP